MSIILTLIIFTVIVVIHEWGHMAVAKLCNVLVEEFAVGMGPKIWGVKKGETLYSIHCLPLGGYCRMADEDPETGTRRGFNSVSVWKRMAIAFAGPLMNFVFAVVVMIVLSLMLPIDTTYVEQISENSPAAEVGIVPGSKIVAINGKSTPIYDYMKFYLMENNGDPVDVTFVYEGKKITTAITPVYNKEQGNYIIGISCRRMAPLVDVGYFQFDRNEIPIASFSQCLNYGINETVFIVKITFEGFIQLFTGKLGMDQLSGPIGVTTTVGDTYKAAVKFGFFSVLVSLTNLAVLLSANLGIINLLPIPGLDGGRILIFLVEIVRRKQLPPEKEGLVNLIGMSLVMILGIFIAYNDIMKLI